MSNEVDIDLKWGIKIALRDGVQLNATMYMPRSQSAASPVVFMLTPYVADTYHERGVYFALHGICFAIVDSRGRGNSKGEFRPFIQEARDGYDVVEWLARQPYCDGQVAMWGGSYNGYSQWVTAKEIPPHLVTIVPAASAHLGTDVPMRCNIFYPYMLQWLSLTAGCTYQNQMAGDNRLWSGLFRRWYESGRPYRELDTTINLPSPAYQEWLAHPELDSYWDAHNPTAEQYAQITIPVLTITGSYDDDQPGALKHYKEHLRNATPAVRSRHYLIIGPWDHLGTRTPRREFGGLKFGSESLVDLPQLHLEWYRWTMAGGPKPGFLRNLVAYYVMGAEFWRYTDILESITSYHKTLYLDSTHNANDVFSAGSLRPVGGCGQPDWYKYDPRDTNGLEIEVESRADGSSLVDQGPMLALREKSLVYHTDPFVEDTEVSGFFKLSAWMAIDCRDTDVYVTLYEVCLDGTHIQLTTDAVRVRYRKGLRASTPISTNEALQYEFNTFTFVSRRIKHGHRLRLLLAPVGRLIQGTGWQRNFNGGGIVAEESVKDAKPVTLRLFHDAKHPSALFVPIGRELLPEEQTQRSSGAELSTAQSS